MLTPARAGAVKAGRILAATEGLALDGAEHAGTLAHVGDDDRRGARVSRTKSSFRRGRADLTPSTSICGEQGACFKTWVIP